MSFQCRDLDSSIVLDHSELRFAGERETNLS